MHLLAIHNTEANVAQSNKSGFFTCLQDMHFRIQDLEEKNNAPHFKTQTCQPKSENLRLLASNVGVSSRPSRGHPLLCTETYKYRIPIFRLFFT